MEKEESDPSGIIYDVLLSCFFQIKQASRRADDLVVASSKLIPWSKQNLKNSES